MSTRYEISLRPIVRYFGVLVPMVIGLPHLIALLGLAYFAILPNKTDADWLKDVSWEGILMSVFFATVGGWTGWRWWRLGAYLDEKEVVLRGLFRSVCIPSANIYEVRLESIQTHSHEHGYSTEQRYEFVDANGETIAILPPSVSYCKDFQAFLSRLERLANLNRRKSPDEQTRSITHLSVEDWTMKDIEDYERNS